MIHYKNLVDDIFLDCMLKKDSKEEYITVTGLVYKFKLKPNKLEEHKEEINTILDNIISEGETINFRHLCENKDGEVWGTSFESELLLVLGRSLNLLNFTKESEQLAKDAFGLPYITRTKIEKDMTLKHTKQ